jgi:tyrosine-specific transport protein
MRQGSLLGGVLLVSGTTIGAGMLALPVVTSVAGFSLSALLFFAVWLFMTTTAFLFLEVCLWMKQESNIISMAKYTLGNFGAVCSWIIYLFLLYSLTTAYLAAGGDLLKEAIGAITGIQLADWMTFVPFLLVFGTFVYLGTRSVDYLNRILVIGLGLAYIVLVCLVPPHIQLSYLKQTNPSGLLLALSVIVTSFGFHIIIPSLVTYLHRDVVKLRKAILLGSIIPLFVYILWNFLVQGVIPAYGEGGLIEVWTSGGQVIRSLRAVVGSSWVIIGASLFSFFAIVTSFLGVSLSLADFLSDFIFVTFGLHSKKSIIGKIFLCLLTFVPPLIFAILYPGIFFLALEYAGAFGVVLLLGVLPALMVWVGRYSMKLKSEYSYFGGRTILITILLCSLFVTLVVVAELNGWLGVLGGIER